MLNLLVSLQDVSVRFLNAYALSGVNLEIGYGGHTAIVGESGSGKSILLKILAGLQSASSGKVSFNFDGNETERPPVHKVVSVDSRHHFKNRSNTSDLYYQQRFNSFDADDAPKVDDYLKEIATQALPGYWTIERAKERLMLESIYDKELIKLSNGETKRLRLASALIKNPELLLLDQPLTGLDVEARQYFYVLLKEVALQGCTIIMAIAPNEIPQIIKQVIVLEKGAIKSIGNRDEFTPFSHSDILREDINSQEIADLLRKPVERFDAFISMKNVNVRYGDKQILKDINWEVKQGERWALLGHNGAGKSTLLSLVYGDNPQAYANDIVLFDKQRGTGESIWDIKKRCGFVSPELFQYFPTDNSCLQVVESGFYDTLGLFRQSERSRAELSLNWMKVLGVDKYARQPLKNIPASAQRLCLLARALVKNPALLILDEPCQGLDDHQKNRFKHIIDAICAHNNLTLIYVTHYLEELPDSVTKHIKLSGGEVVEQSV